MAPSRGYHEAIQSSWRNSGQRTSTASSPHMGWPLPQVACIRGGPFSRTPSGTTIAWVAAWTRVGREAEAWHRHWWDLRTSLPAGLVILRIQGLRSRVGTSVGASAAGLSTHGGRLSHKGDSPLTGSVRLACLAAEHKRPPEASLEGSVSGPVRTPHPRAQPAVPRAWAVL